LKVEKAKTERPIEFGELEEGEAFREVDDEQVHIKTDEGSGVCLESGTITERRDDDKVIRVNCEVVVY